MIEHIFGVRLSVLPDAAIASLIWIHFRSNQNISGAKCPVPCHYTTCNVAPTKSCWLCISIYQKYSFFLHLVLNLVIEEEKHFAGRQEGTLKNVEQAFSAPRDEFDIVGLSCKLWSKRNMDTITYFYIISHHMVVCDKKLAMQILAK